MRFRVGDKVSIHPSSCFHNEDKHFNPDSAVIGVITGINHSDSYLPIKVDWPNGSNTYDHKDLINRTEEEKEIEKILLQD